MTPPKLNANRVIYYDIQRNWKKLKPLFESPKATEIWQRNMADFDNLRKQDCVKRGHEKRNDKWRIKFETPSHFDSCDWRYTTGRKGPKPAFWDYACHRACHWVADLGLYVATYGVPEMKWQIVTNSEKHSTVWNGCVKYPILFDINFSAIGVSPSEAWTLASTNGELYPPKVMLHSHLFHSDFTRWFKKVTKRGYI